MRGKPAESHRAPGRVWPLIAIAVLGVITSVVLFFNARMQERWHLTTEFDHRARERALAIESDLRYHLAHVESIAAWYTASGSIDARDFSTFTRPILNDHPGIQVLGIDFVVSAAEREDHETAQRLGGKPNYRITERGPDGRLVPAGDRAEYVVVTLLEPLEGNKAADGYDIASEAVRREALERARDSGEPTITGRIRLVQETEHQYSTLVCVPIHAGGRPDALAERRSRLVGYAVGALRFGDVVDNALAGLRPTGIELHLTDDSGPPEQQLLHYHRSRTLTGSDEPVRPDDMSGSLESYAFEIGGRQLRVYATPTAAFVAARTSWIPAGVLVFGLLITALLVGYVSWHSSVTGKLRRAVADRRQAESRRADFGRVLDESRDEIYIFHAETLRFLHVNRGAWRNLGYTEDELREKTPLDLKRELTAESFTELIRPVREGEREKVEFSTVHRRKDGSLYDVEVHLQRTTFDGDPAFVAVILDITDRKKLEARHRQSQRLEALGTLAGGIAHDFNNLLTSIMGYTELTLKDAPPGSSSRANLTEVLTASERAREVVQRILAFSRDARGEHRPIDLGALVREVLQLMRGSLPATIAIHEELSDGCGIVGESTQIHQVLMNLCTNAAQAMQETGGTLRVRLESVELSDDDADRLGDLDPGAYARLSVSDNGSGIPPEILDRIFDPFFTTKKPGEGTGMGLAVAHGITRSHDGSLTVTSDKDRGTVFEIHLPLAEAVELPVADSSKPAPAAGESVLLVDDDPMVLNVLENMLKRSGYQVETRHGGREALELVVQRPAAFDVIVTDYAMPTMSGTELARELARVAPDTSVILVSGFGDLVDEEEIICSGIREKLTKPLKMGELSASVRRVLDRNRSSQAP